MLTLTEHVRRQEIRPSSLMLSCLWTFMAPYWLSSSIGELLWRQNDSFGHDLAVFGIIFWGPLTIIYAAGLCYKLLKLPSAVGPAHVEKVQTQTRLLVALVLGLGVTGFCLGLAVLAMKRLGEFRGIELASLIVLALLGLLFSWHEFKRLCADLT